MRFLTAGESHGKALVGIIEGCPSNLEISAKEIQEQLYRRKLGFGRGDRQKIEDEELEILSGVRFGKTLGSPIAIMIENKDWVNWESTMSVEGNAENSQTIDRKVEVPRPGHADYVGALKYDHNDMRNVLERASARETAMRVALASVARKFLAELNIQVVSRVIQIGDVKDTSAWPEFSPQTLPSIDSNPVRSTSEQASMQMVETIKIHAAEGNTLGGVFEVVAVGLPIGLGSYSQWDRRIEGQIAKSFMSLNAIKGVEVGEGNRTATLSGSDAHDEIIFNSEKNGIDYRSNRSGGITGGMTTGKPLLVRAAMKPLSTMKKPLQSVSLKEKKESQAHFERSDVCAVPAAAVIGESLLCLVLMEEILIKFGGDSMGEIKKNYGEWREVESRRF